MRSLMVIFGMTGVASASPRVDARVTAPSVVVLADAERANALQLAMSGRGVAIASAPAPEGELWLDRAAEAQRAAMAAGAEAAVWIDGDELSVVSADGRTFRHAPLGDESPRVFAAIATSLIDEMVAPPESFDVDVQIDMAPPGVIAPAPPPAPSLYPRGDRTLFEVGPMLSPVSGGLEAELAYPVTPAWRVGAMAGANALFVDPQQGPLFLAALEVRHVGAGVKHTDIGGVIGAAAAAADIRDGHTWGIFYAGVRVSRTWEHAGSGLQGSLVPVVAATPQGPIPAIYASLRWELPL